MTSPTHIYWSTVCRTSTVWCIDYSSSQALLCKGLPWVKEKLPPLGYKNMRNKNIDIE